MSDTAAFRRVIDAEDNDQVATCVALGERLLAESPESTLTRFSVANTLYLMARYEDALAQYDAILQSDPDLEWAVRNQIGHLNRYRGDFKAAEACYARAAEIEPDNASSFVYLGAVQVRQGRLKDAERSHRTAVQCERGRIDEAYHNLGLVLRGQGRLTEAKECFEEAISRDSEYDEAIEALRDVTAALAVLDGGPQPTSGQRPSDANDNDS